MADSSECPQLFQLSDLVILDRSHTGSTPEKMCVNRDIFFSDADATVLKLNKALLDNNVADIRFEADGLKGLMGMLGAKRLYKFFERICRADELWLDLCRETILSSIEIGFIELKNEWP